MAAITGAAIVAAGTAYAANRQAAAAKKGAAAQRSAADQAIAEQQAARDEYRTLSAPYTGLGSQAAGILTRLQGGDMTAFTASPDYQFRLGQGQDALLRAASSRGSVNSGGTDLDLLDYGQGMASSEFGNFVNRQLALAGLGQNAAAGAGNAGQSAASNIGNLQVGVGNAAAGGYAGQANATSSMIGQLGQLVGQYGQQYGGGRGSSYAPSGAGSNYNFGSESPGAGGAFGGQRQWNFGG